MMKRPIQITFLFLSFVTIWAHQPVMDMAPRWKGGYGIQFRYENIIRDRLTYNGKLVSNPFGLQSETSTLWVEGVYTFTRAHRLTFKLPLVEKQARLEKDGQFHNFRESGAGDLILGFQNKLYFNETNYTGNFGFTPSIRIPTGSTSGDLELGRGAVDYGVSFSASVELFKLYTFLDLFAWFPTEGTQGERPGNTLAVDFDLGIHPYHNMQLNRGIFIMMGFNGRQYEPEQVSGGKEPLDSGGSTFEVAPTLVLYNKNWMIRTQYHIPVYQNNKGAQLFESPRLQVGIGFVFKSFTPF
ncbi:hypothetical protein JYT44_02010 [Caldithrix abyssi]|nr:hypothetical protein [Caldithrix abyssi]